MCSDLKSKENYGIGLALERRQKCEVADISAWRIPTDRGAWLATAHGFAKIQT